MTAEADPVALRIAPQPVQEVEQHRIYLDMITTTWLLEQPVLQPVLRLAPGDVCIPRSEAGPVLHFFFSDF
jgi:hypothetical protein